MSFTTTPHRIADLEACVHEMLDAQTRPPDMLVLYVPQRFARTGQEYVVPETLSALQERGEYRGRFCIRRVDVDMGPLTKIYYAARDFANDDSVQAVVSIDDDVRYDAHFLEELSKAYAVRPMPCSSVYAFMGVIEDGLEAGSSRFVHAEFIHGQQCAVDVIGGYRGVMYDTQLLRDVDFVAKCERGHAAHCARFQRPIMEDDHFISNLMRAAGVSLCVLRTAHPGNRNASHFLDMLNFKFTENSAREGLYGGDAELSKALADSHRFAQEFFRGDVGRS